MKAGGPSAKGTPPLASAVRAAAAVAMVTPLATATTPRWAAALAAGIWTPWEKTTTYLSLPQPEHRVPVLLPFVSHRFKSDSTSLHLPAVFTPRFHTLHLWFHLFLFHPLHISDSVTYISNPAPVSSHKIWISTSDLCRHFKLHSIKHLCVFTRAVTGAVSVFACVWFSDFF